MSGWLKLHRTITEWGWADEPNMLALWVHLLANAYFADGEYRGEKIRRGQVIFAYRAWEKKTGISVQKMRTCIERLKSTREVTLRATRNFTIITIEKYNEYQEKSDNQHASQHAEQQATNTQSTRYKEGKKERIYYPPTPKSESETGDDDFNAVYDHGVSIFPQLAQKPAHVIRSWLKVGRVKTICYAIDSCRSGNPETWAYFEPAVKRGIEKAKKNPPSNAPKAPTDYSAWVKRMNSTELSEHIQLRRKIGAQDAIEQTRKYWDKTHSKEDA